MTVPAKPNSLQTYQTILYNRALHPELFELKGRRVVRHGEYEFEGWVMPGSHILRFERGPLCECELVTDQEDGLPDSGIVTALLCAGERDFEHRFERQGVVYMSTVQTETLPENLYMTTVEELREHAAKQSALCYEWNDDTGLCLSILDIERYSREIHAHCYHLMANQGLVLRTQTIFEQL